MPDLPLAQPHARNGPPYHRNVRDYQFGTRIGEGSYSTVYLAVALYDNKTYAIKILSKKHIVRENKIKYVNIEKTALHRLGQHHPGIVQLYHTFQDELQLFFVLDFAEYGELLSIISKFGSLLEAVLKFYMLQILDAVKFIHLKGIIHRDLKPENILVGYDFNLKITDFGTAKLLGPDEEDLHERINYDNVSGESTHSPLERKRSFVGTAEYVPPELLKFNACGFKTDIWAIACILFQFFNGQPPFKGATEYLTFEKIIHLEYSYRRQIPLMVKEIIDKTLVFSPKDRPTILEIQAMPWFTGVHWNNMDYLWKRSAPRFEPYTAPQTPSNVLSPPQLKSRNNRHAKNLASNYKLHAQIQRSENLFPSFLHKKAYQPATRVPVFSSPVGASFRHTPSSLPVMYSESQFKSNRPYSDQVIYQQSPVLNPRAHSSQTKQSGYAVSHAAKPTDCASSPDRPTSASNAHKGHQVVGQSPIERKSSALQIAKQASQAAVMPQLEKQMHGTNLGRTASPTSPERRNPRKNTAFASMRRNTPSTAVKQGGANGKTSLAFGPLLEAPQKEPTRATAVKRSLINLSEASSFLAPDEKIVKLDSILKLRVRNTVCREKAGNLDNDVIEQIIYANEFNLDKRMIPVVACVTDKARLFLIEPNLDVIMIDLTVNRGHDYLMYDYEFESIMIESDKSDSDAGEEMFGYLILELVKEAGDLVFLKRFSDKQSVDYESIVHVIGPSGETLLIGRDVGWIDCLIKTKKRMDDEKTQKPPQSSESSRNGLSARKSGSSNKKVKNKSSDDRKTFNNFALAAAAAAHQ